MDKFDVSPEIILNICPYITNIASIVHTLICVEVYDSDMLSPRKPNRPTDWSGTETCPFCGTNLPDPGAGFIEHTKGSPRCRGAFEGWRNRIADDIYAEWSG